MTKKEAKERIEKLKKEINHHRYLYHVLDKIEISDAALDSLKHELYKLEQEFPDLITPDSPTQRVGGQPLEKFKKIKHSTPMLSLEDAFSTEEMKDWENRIKKLSALGWNYFAELKIDGFAISLVYQDGVFVEGSTRGDGLIGEDVTQNLKTIESIPLKLEKNIKGRVEIRGEVFMSIKSFEKVNQEQKKKELEPYANPRNIAAGSIRQLNPKIAASRQLDFLAYDLITNLGQKTHEEEHKICKELGFKTDKLARSCKNLDEVIEFWEEINKKREKLPYQIDGIVVSVNDNKIFEKLGVVGKAPRGSIAFKFPGKEATTIVEDIKISIGRTGVLTPIAHLKPVGIGGTTVSRATLHNKDEIKRLGLKIGDTVIVQRAGDVIPDIVKILPHLRTGKEKEFKMPETFCGQKVIRPKGEVAHRILNPEKCELVQREKIYHFASKKAFDIVGLGPQIINQLADQGLISSATDLFELKEGDLIPLERFGEKSAGNILSAIQKSKKISLPKFIFALGILHVGEETANLLSQEISNSKFLISKPKDVLKVFHRLSLEKLQKIPDIGPVVAKNIYDWFQNKENIAFLQRLEKTGIKIINPKRFQVPSSMFHGKTFVLTGEIESMPREAAKEKIRELGGDVSESVSKKTSYVVVGKNPGSKYEKAKKLGVKIIDEKGFLKILTI